MCCRYFIRESDPDLLPIIDAALKSPLIARYAKVRPAPLVRFGEVKPADLIAVIASDRQQKTAVFPMTWGFTVPGRSAPIINARSETASEKQSFADAWKQHRCIIPASWYYEWQHLPTEDGRKTTTTKYAIQPENETITFLCGLYRIENGLPAFVVLTRDPCDDIAHIHDRMPLILSKGAIRDWVNPTVKAEDVLPYAVTSMAAEKAE